MARTSAPTAVVVVARARRRPPRRAPAPSRPVAPPRAVTPAGMRAPRWLVEMMMEEMTAPPQRLLLPQEASGIPSAAPASSSERRRRTLLDIDESTSNRTLYELPTAKHGREDQRWLLRELTASQAVQLQNSKTVSANPTYAAQQRLPYFVTEAVRPRGPHATTMVLNSVMRSARPPRECTYSAAQAGGRWDCKSGERGAGAAQQPEECGKGVP
jgi:hypothetical protein